MRAGLLPSTQGRSGHGRAAQERISVKSSRSNETRLQHAGGPTSRDQFLKHVREEGQRYAERHVLERLSPALPRAGEAVDIEEFPGRIRGLQHLEGKFLEVLPEKDVLCVCLTAPRAEGRVEARKLAYPGKFPVRSGRRCHVPA